MPRALGVWPVAGSFLFWLLLVVAFQRVCQRLACRAGDGRVHGPAGFSFGQDYDISAGQAGVLAMVMMAGAMRVAVSFAVACGKDDLDLDLRARCRSRLMTFRYFPISLVTAW